MPVSSFKLVRVRDLALVTLDNGEDWTKPTTLGETALQSLAGSVRQERPSKPPLPALYASRCATCGRAVTVEEFLWDGERGAPVRKTYRCTYCLNHRIVDRYRDELGRGTSQIGFFRFRSPEQMVAEIRWVLERYPGIGTFILDDDLFTLESAHAIAFARAYRAAGFTIPWVVNSHVNRLDPVMARELAAGGCKILKLGIESGSERVRREDRVPGEDGERQQRESEPGIERVPDRGR